MIESDRPLDELEIRSAGVHTLVDGNTTIVTLRTRGGVRGLLYAVLGAMAMLPFSLVLTFAPLFATPGIIVATGLGWAALCSWFNRVRIEAGPHTTTVSYGPLPWLPRAREEIGPLRRLSIRREFVPSKSRHRRPYERPFLDVADDRGRTISIRLGPPGSTIAALRPDAEAALRAALGIEGRALSRRPQPRKLAAKGGGVGLCPRDNLSLSDERGPLSERACARCHGSFVPEHAMRGVLVDRLGLAMDDLREIAEGFGGVAITCAGCGKAMDSVRLRGATIDLCFGCGGAWLDEGESEPFHALVQGAV